MKQFVCYIIVLIIGAAAGMFLPHICPILRPEPEVVSITDTLTVRDTNIYNFPDMVSEIIIPEDVIIIRDSLIISEGSTVALPLQQRHYKGEDYEAWVSGYSPRLDSLLVFPETKYITNEIRIPCKRKRWGIGIQAGYGVGVSSGQIRAFPYIGVGFSYNIIQF